MADSSSPGVLAVWNDLQPGHEAEFEAWYQRQHVPERLQVPGFREARRYLAAAGSPRYCAFYWLDNVEVLASPAYLERLAQPTPWTRRMMPRFQAMGRTPCTVLLERGCGIGGAMGWVAMIGERQRDAPVERIRVEFDLQRESPELVRMHLWQCTGRIANLANPEQRLRANADRVARWIVVIEATTETAVQEHLGRICAALAGCADSGELVRAPVYRLMWSLRASEAGLPSRQDKAGR